MEDGLLTQHFDLLTKTRATIEGILASGSSDIWSTYGALRRAREILHHIFIHGLLADSEEELLKYLIDTSRKGSKTAIAFHIDPVDPLNLEQFIEEYCLLGFNTSSVIDYCFLVGNQKTLSTIYEGTAILRKRPCLLCLKLCFAALEQCSLELLASLSDVLTSQEQFRQYLKEEQNFDPVEDEDESKKHLSSSGTESLSYPSYTYSVSSGDEHLLEKHDTEDDLPMLRKDQVMKNDMNSENLKRRSIHQDVLMVSALAAVMETNEDGLIWFDEVDRKSLLSEPGEIARNRITRMREISRSESSLFNEHGQINTGANVGESRTEKEVVTPSEPRPQEPHTADMVSSQDQESMSLKRSSKVISTPFKRGHLRSKSDQIGVPRVAVEDAAKEDTQQEEKLSMSAPNATNEENRHQDYFYEPEDGYMFPKPYKGQSLISYLDSRSYDTGAELDRENAHFSICEALITAIEQMKCSKHFDSDSDDSDEEIRSLKERIKEKRLRKRLLKLEAQRHFSDQSTSTASNSTSSFFSGSTFSTSQSSSAADEAAQPTDAVLQKVLSRSWENVSLSPQRSRTSVKSEATTNGKPDGLRKDEPESKPEPEPKPDDYSAEVVAKSLLKKFAGCKLPAASDLKWIVSEDQVPQDILPLPTAWPVSPDDALFNGANVNEDEVDNIKNLRKTAPTRLRGNFEWAPPRPQLIFTPHPYVKRKAMLQKQHYRCAGCGLKVTPSLSKRFRYCHYLGKYFCTSCHQNRMMSIPSKIIDKWDFKNYPISDFALEFLNKIWNDPLFDISAIDNNVYKKIKCIEITRELRLKLHYAKRFLKTCRHAESLYSELQKLPQHLMDDIHIYSLEDFTQVKSGDLQIVLRSLVTSALKHIKDCQLCAVKGFMCEYCRDYDDILYPFELNRVATCRSCKTCYHKTCFVPEKCPKCVRVRARQRLLDTQALDSS